jgi:hypothetical protein
MPERNGPEGLAARLGAAVLSGELPPLYVHIRRQLRHVIPTASAIVQSQTGSPDHWTFRADIIFSCGYRELDGLGVMPVLAA